MAIDQAELELWRAMRKHLPRHPAVLQIGESNWYGDVPTESVPELQGAVLDGLDPFEIARVFYQRVLDFSELDAVDMQGKTAWRFDLNKPLPLSRRYDVVINTGTAEHVFDQRQVFESIHQWTEPGGLMVHTFPVAGCPDHGFYTHQPCLLQQLAAANGYETLATVRHEAGGDQMLHLAWRKGEDQPFRVPQQNGYAGLMGGGGLGAAPVMSSSRKTEKAIVNLTQETLVEELQSLQQQAAAKRTELSQIEGAEMMIRHLLAKLAAPPKQPGADLRPQTAPDNGVPVQD